MGYTESELSDLITMSRIAQEPDNFPLFCLLPQKFSEQDLLMTSRSRVQNFSKQTFHCVCSGNMKGLKYYYNFERLNVSLISPSFI